MAIPWANKFHISLGEESDLPVTEEKKIPIKAMKEVVISAWTNGDDSSIVRIPPAPSPSNCVTYAPEYMKDERMFSIKVTN